MPDDNPLPNDGLPRITLEGYRILKNGLIGSFDEWEKQIGNHPLTLPNGTCSNVKICCDPEKNHFALSVWYGQNYPVIDDCLALAPVFYFDKIEEWPIQSVRGSDKLEYIKLGQSYDVYPWDGVIILIDDYGTDNRHDRTLYHTWRGRYGDIAEVPEPKPEPLKKPVKTVSLFDFGEVKQ